MAYTSKADEIISKYNFTEEELKQLKKEMGFKDPAEMAKDEAAIIDAEINAWATGKPMPTISALSDEDKKIIDSILSWANF